MNDTSKAAAPKRKAPKFLSMVTAIVLLGSIAVDGFCAYDLLGKKVVSSSLETVKENENASSTDSAASQSAERTAFEDKKNESIKKGNRPILYTLLDGMENKTVTDKYSGLQLLKALQSELGVKEAESELQFDREFSSDNWVFRHYKQLHGNMEVLGGGLTITTEKDTGKVVDISGKQFDIPDDFQTEPKVQFEEAKKTAQSYITDKCGKDLNTVKLDNEGTKIVPSENGDVSLGYKVSATDKNTGKKIMDIIVDADSGKVTSVKQETGKTIVKDSPTNTGRKVNTLDNEQSTLDVYRPSDEETVLDDSDRGISIVKEEDKSVKLGVDNNETVCSYNPNEMTDEDKTYVDVMSNAEAAHDFFDDILDHDGIDGNGSNVKIVVGVDDIEYEGITGTEKINMDDRIVYGDDSVIYVGEESDTSTPATQTAADEIGKAYADGVIESASDLYNGYTDAETGEAPVAQEIAKGIADVFGELAEDYAIDGQLNGSCDWSNDTLTADPTKADVNDENSSGEQIILSFAQEAVKAGVEAEVMAHLMYDVLPVLTCYSNYSDFRKCVEVIACEYLVSEVEGRRLSDKQFEAIIDAFDTVGIAPKYDYTLSAQGTIKVYDKDDELYSSFKVQLTSYNDPENVIYNGEATSDSFTFPAGTPNGLYILILSDKNDELVTKSYTILINDNSQKQKTSEYPSEIKAYTAFGAEARDVVLVLDVSGSMDGSPIQQTREASAKFVDTVLNQSPSTRISLVTFSASAKDIITSSNQKSPLLEAVSRLDAWGGTNTYDGLEHAQTILETSKSKKKLIVLMSDGVPNDGPSNGGDYNTPIVELADKIKATGVTIYTLGFFHNLTGSDLSTCQKLMTDIASEGYDYVVDNADDVKFDVEDPESDLYKVFNDFAEMINGKKYINIRIACPVDVTVSYNGETLSSNKKHPITRASFGSLSYEKIIDDETGEEKEDNVKVLRLEEGTDYEVCINGTGKGKMDYTISYPDEDGEYTDVRSFKNVPITKDTVIATSTKQEEKVGLSVDSDGDGKFDMNYEAAKNKKAEKTGSKDNMMFIILIAANSLLAVVLIIYAIMALKKRANKKATQPVMPTNCTNCGAELVAGIKFCRSCGTPVAALPAPVQNINSEPVKKASKAPMIIKLTVIGVCVAVTAVVVGLYNSPATTVFKQLRSNQTESAKQIFDNSMKNSGISAKYLAFLTDHHMSKAETAYNDNKLTQADYVTLLEGIKALDLDDVSNEAKDKLKELSKSDSSDKKTAETEKAEEKKDED
ncbi:MAG: VWA domain-containing protein [Ruminococcus sp.]|nr:VWA domain-containing protein [Ruminococcus sp.]